MSNFYHKTLILLICIISCTLGFQNIIAEGKNPAYTTIGNGVSHEYKNIPFEIYGVGSLSVFHIVNETVYKTNYATTLSLSEQGDKIHFIIQGAYALHVNDGITVGKIIAYYNDNTYDELNLISGVNIAEWAYDRPENQELLKHTKLPPAYSFWVDTDSEYFYWGHYFYVNMDIDDSKKVDRLGLYLFEIAYPDPHWYKIDIHAITIEDDNIYSPVANAGVDEIVTIGDVVDFIGTGEDTDGYIKKFEWDFDGDGNWDWFSDIHGITAHKYMEEGTYNAVFRVTDNDGLKDTDTKIVQMHQSIIDLHIINLDDDDLTITIYIDDINKVFREIEVPAAGTTMFNPGIIIPVEEGEHYILISYNDPDLGENTNSVTVDIGYGEKIWIDLYTLGVNKSNSNYYHFAEKLENEDKIRHGFYFPAEKVKMLAENIEYPDFIAGKIIEDIDRVQGKLYYSDLGVYLGKFISKSWISDDLISIAPSLKNSDGSYQDFTYYLSVSTSEILKIGISVIDFIAKVWRSITTPGLDKFLEVSTSIACTIDLFKDRVDEWKYDDSIDIDIVKFASDIEPLIELSVDYEADVGKSIIINVAKEAIEFSRPEELVIKLDGKKLRQADDYYDALDPNNEEVAEYYVNDINDEGAQVIVSIPSFSEHIVSISHFNYSVKLENKELLERNTPGFEILLMVFSFLFILFWKSKVR